MADVAQLVRAPVCGTGGRGFKSHHSPQENFPHLLGEDFYIKDSSTLPTINEIIAAEPPKKTVSSTALILLVWVT